MASQRARSSRSDVAWTACAKTTPGSRSLPLVAAMTRIRVSSRPHRTTPRPAAAAALASAMPHAPAPATPIGFASLTPSRAAFLCSWDSGRRRPRRPGKPWRSRPVGPAPSQNARLRLGMGSARRRRDASPRAARSLTAMPEIDLPTVIFALVALFVAYKLRSVLGMRQDSGRQSGGLLAPLRRVPAPPTAPVVPTDTAAPAPPPATDRWKGVAEPDPAVWSGLDAIAAADRSFSPQAFLSGARVAYDMVVHAFAAGDSATLRNLMTPEAFANFDNAIRTRAAAGQTMTTTVVSIDDATIVGAQLVGAAAQIRGGFAAHLPPGPPAGPRAVAE